MTDKIHVYHNHPPMVAEVFDREYLEAQREAFAANPPSSVVRSHRWMGTLADRTAGAGFVARRLGNTPDPDRVVVSNGTQSSLMMLFSGLVGKGGVLLTEAMTYPPLLTFAQHLGFRIVGAPIDEFGLVPDALRRIIETEKPSALYAVPTYQNPTTSIMPAERREEIAAIARQYNVAIIEDDIYSLMTPDLPPPLSSYAPELSWYVLGTAKSLAAGLKVAYVVAPSAAAAEKYFWPGVRGTHWMTPPVGAAVVTTLVGNGGADRIIGAVADEVRARQALAQEMLADIPYVTKPEALHVWFDLPAGMTRHALVALAEENGVVIGGSDQYMAEGRGAPEAVRMGIGNPKSRDKLATALDRFLRAYRSLQA